MPTLKKYAVLTAAVLAALTAAAPSPLHGTSSSSHLAVRHPPQNNGKGGSGGDGGAGGRGGNGGSNNGGNNSGNGGDGGPGGDGGSGGPGGNDNGSGNPNPGGDGGDGGQGGDGGDGGNNNGGNNSGNGGDGGSGGDGGDGGPSGENPDPANPNPNNPNPNPSNPSTCGTCNPISGLNYCDITTSCINTGANYHCACRAGYKAGNGNDFRLRMPNYEFLVFVPTGQSCNALCNNPYGYGPELCREVPLLEVGVCRP